LPACVTVTRVTALFGDGQEDMVILDLADPVAFEVDAGDMVVETINASEFEDIPDNLWMDHCEPETSGALRVNITGGEPSVVTTDSLSIGCACC
jgi:hypothetical protein